MAGWTTNFPNCNSPDLVLRVPTADECLTIWSNTATAWSDSLPTPLYLAESLFLTSVALAKDGGMTSWILVQKDLAPGQRQILSSCETFRKRSITSNAEGDVSDNIVHGVASVFCPVPYRRRGYAARMMRELAKELYTWQTDTSPCVASTLYSDIGKDFYSKLGWHPNSTNSQVDLRPKTSPWPSIANPVSESDLEALCARDEAMLRCHMAHPTTESPTRLAIVPDLAHMCWHIAKEDFATQHLFGRTPHAKGVIVGSPGSQTWVTWVHRYYARPDTLSGDNVLYILRLVRERDETDTRLRSDATKSPPDDVYEQQCQQLKAVLQAAQAEAAEWKLDVIKLWDPSPLVMHMLAQSGLDYAVTEREDEGVASLLWYDSQGAVASEAPLWVNNEHYAWQ